VEKGSCSSSTLISLEALTRWSLVDSVDRFACEVMGTLIRIGVLCKDWREFWGSRWGRSRTFNVKFPQYAIQPQHSYVGTGRERHSARSHS
jgi:hypothetical protein